MTTDQAVVLFCFGAALVAIGCSFVLAMSKALNPSPPSFWAAGSITVAVLVAGTGTCIYAFINYLNLIQGVTA